MYLINNFYDIAWMDPFPDEEKIIAEKEPPVAPKAKKGKQPTLLASGEDYDDEKHLG